MPRTEFEEIFASLVALKTLERTLFVVNAADEMPMLMVSIYTVKHPRYRPALIYRP